MQLATEKAEKATRKTTGLFIGAGLMLVTGAASIYFKQQANDSYDRYLQTGDPTVFSGYYDEANKYDNLFRISFIGFQASLIFTLYNLFR
jgi:hypothetical protein